MLTGIERWLRAGMIERAQRYMPNASPSPGHFALDANGTHTPKTPLSARRANSSSLHEGQEETEADRRQRELYSNQQHMLREQRSADQDKLLKAISGKSHRLTGTLTCLETSCCATYLKSWDVKGQR